MKFDAFSNPFLTKNLQKLILTKFSKIKETLREKKNFPHIYREKKN